MALEIASDRATVDAILDEALAASGADETEALYMGTNAALSRYTRNEIHENVLEKNRTLNIRAVIGKRVGVASTNRLDSKSIAQTVATAATIARFAPADEQFAGLPGDTSPTVELAGAYDEATANASPDRRADAVRVIVDEMKRHGLEGAGYVATREDAIAIANSKGVRRFFRATDASVNIKAIGADSSGYAEGFARALSALDFEALASRAARKAVAGKSPGALPPGKYAVVLEPPAFREFLVYLSWAAFGAQPFEEGSSFMTGRIGDKVMGENVTILDAFKHPLGDGIPFDFEGVPRHEVRIIDRGIARDVVYDSQYAAKTGHANTGHALPAPNTEGPFPLNVMVDPGSRSQSEIVKDIDRGVLVSRTWYIRLVDQRKMLITGMTRDGVFLIENGQVTRGLKNMRFNESIIEALTRCELAKDLSRSESYVVPAVRIDGFAFTSGTTF